MVNGTIVRLWGSAAYFSCNSSVQQCMTGLHTLLSTWLYLHRGINWYIWPKTVLTRSEVRTEPEYELVTVFTPEVWKAEQIFGVNPGALPQIWSPPCWVQTQGGSWWEASELSCSIWQNQFYLFAIFASEEVNVVRTHTTQWMLMWIKCLFHLNLHLFWSAFFRINFHSFFLSVFVAVSSPLHSPSLLSLSLSPDKASSAFCCIILTLAVFLKGGGKKKKMYYPPTGNWFWSFALKT